MANFNVEASQYLLSKRIIGRFYGFFLDKQADKYFPENLEATLKLRDMSDCAYKKLGPNEIKTGGFRSRYIPKKKAASAKNESMYSISHMNLEFFWKTVADLIAFCKFPNENQNTQAYCYILTELEAGFLKTEKQKFLLSIWESADNSKTAKSIAKIYANASREDENFSLFLSKFYCSKIFSLSSECTINYMHKGIFYFIGVHDSLENSRVIFIDFLSIFHLKF